MSGAPKSLVIRILFAGFIFAWTILLLQSTATSEEDGAELPEVNKKLMLAPKKHHHLP